MPSIFSKADLAAISERGILLAGYDTAAWHASDAVIALHPPEDAVSRHVARQTGTGWVVAFGKLNATDDRFLVAYEVTRSKNGGEFRVQQYKPPRQDMGFNLAAARGMETVLKDFRGLTRPYNIAALPAKPGGLFVYMYPAQVRVDVYPYGADVRYRVSSDGKRIIEKRQLHQSLLEFIPPHLPGTLASGYHAHVLTDLPEDTDVLLVLMREPKVPETVAAGGHMFTIETDGRISVADSPR
jgi:hypothetical protein